jgi:hypothetical protein
MSILFVIAAFGVFSWAMARGLPGERPVRSS